MTGTFQGPPCHTIFQDQFCEAEYDILYIIFNIQEHCCDSLKMVRAIPQTIACHVYKVEAAVLLQPLDHLIYQILPVGEVEQSKLGVNCEWNGSVFPQPERQIVR